VLNISLSGALLQAVQGALPCAVWRSPAVQRAFIKDDDMSAWFLTGYGVLFSLQNARPVDILHSVSSFAKM
jgi:hypothetical protein